MVGTPADSVGRCRAMMAVERLGLEELLRA